jgi:hypothetical protein
MSVYASGIQINISADGMVKLDFIDAANQMSAEKVASVVVTLDSFRNLRDGATQVIEQHEAKMKDMAKAN